jgi:hypothetical protein
VRGAELLLALALLAAACGGGETARLNDPRALVLSTRDLPRGYRYGDDTGCGRIYSTEGEWPKLEPLFRAGRPQTCSMQLEWVWTRKPAYGHTVTSEAYVFRDATMAARAFAARRELASFTASLDARERKSLELGDEAELLRGHGLNDAASGIVWRNANAVAVLVVEPADDAAARALAAKQQRRMEKPSRPVRIANDPELELDDPTARFPVYWLGRSFDPPGPLPSLELELANVGGNGPGQTVQLWYRGGVALDIWKPDDWDRFRRTLLGRLIWDSPCAVKSKVRVEGGRAELFHGYGEPRPATRPCPARPRDRVIGHVYYDDAVVALNMPYCYTCARPSGSNPYNTVEALETVVRSLEVRARR